MATELGLEEEEEEEEEEDYRARDRFKGYLHPSLGRGRPSGKYKLFMPGCGD